ncbi:MAG: inorganic pyrophosphatase [Gammaproteobacteria bacterium RIFCSPHIGHO2_12_FULL_41_20]|nr:MAG: inorganic pyrophosphatase [Gammaproteobacteria bacterium RIFCSPHIGHO2_12_FULL_41_20]
MNMDAIEAGKKVPEDINVVIEIPSRSNPIKYEIDKASGMVMVDRFIATSMHYPCDYGFIPHTLSEDGDPADVLVISPYSLLPGVMIRCRPIGLLRMTDESGKDAKILAVPINKLTLLYQHIHKPEDLGTDLLATIEHFFKHYKDLEKDKWAKIDGWEGTETAHKEILSSINRYQQKKGVVA